jgi:hypothetical protein
MRIFARAAAVSSALLAGLAVCGVAVPSAQASAPIAAGDLLAGDYGGNLNHYSSDGTLLASIPVGVGLETGACQDNNSGYIYQTNDLYSGTITQIAPDGTVSASAWASGLFLPESCVVAPNGDVLVGENGNIVALGSPSSNSPGSVVATYPTGSSEWISLDSDNCTLNVADESPTIKEYNICTNSPAGSLTTSSGAAYQNEPMSNGDLLVAAGPDVEEVNASGVVRTYAVPGGSLAFSLAIAADGNSFWVGDHNSGQISRISMSTGNVLQTLTQPGSGAGGLLVYGQGHTTSPATASNISGAVTPSSALYTMKISMDLSGVACPATVSMTIGSNLTRSKPLCGTGGTAPASTSLIVSVLSLDTRTSYPISVTIQDANGTSKTATGSLTTPQAPAWVAVGDSYSSGHHQDRDEPCGITNLYCLGNPYAYTTTLTPNDTSFSWVSRARDQLMTRLGVPSQWTMLVDDVAQSGALATNYAKPGPSSTNCDGCGEQADMTAALGVQAGSWNIVSIDGGGIDVGLVKALSNYYTATLGQGKPWAESNRIDCPDTDAVDRNVHTLSSGISKALTSVLVAAKQADGNARLVAITYPYILNRDSASSVCGHDSRLTPHIGVFHTENDLDAILTGLSVPGLKVVDLRKVAGFVNNPLNDIQQTRYFGYPHPNSRGQDTIAAAVVRRLVG